MHTTATAPTCRISGSTTSAIDPLLTRRHLGGSGDANARFAVFFEIPNRRAIALIGIASAPLNRRISAQSSTLITFQSVKGSTFTQRPGVSFH
jgi:hypothetical protein